MANIFKVLRSLLQFSSKQNTRKPSRLDRILTVEHKEVDSDPRSDYIDDECSKSKHIQMLKQDCEYFDNYENNQSQEKPYAMSRFATNKKSTRSYVESVISEASEVLLNQPVPKRQRVMKTPSLPGRGIIDLTKDSSYINYNNQIYRASVLRRSNNCNNRSVSNRSSFYDSGIHTPCSYGSQDFNNTVTDQVSLDESIGDVSKESDAQEPITYNPMMYEVNLAGGFDASCLYKVWANSIDSIITQKDLAGIDVKMEIIRSVSDHQRTTLQPCEFEFIHHAQTDQDKAKAAEEVIKSALSLIAHSFSVKVTFFSGFFDDVKSEFDNRSEMLGKESRCGLAGPIILYTNSKELCRNEMFIVKTLNEYKNRNKKTDIATKILFLFSYTDYTLRSHIKLTDIVQAYKLKEKKAAKAIRSTKEKKAAKTIGSTKDSKSTKKSKPTPTFKLVLNEYNHEEISKFLRNKNYKTKAVVFKSCCLNEKKNKK